MAQPPVNLGTATSFAVLAGAGITNTGPTTIIGDVGTFPITTESGFGTVTIIGTNHAGDAVTQGAKTDLVTAYNDAAGRVPFTVVFGDLGGQTLAPGVYQSASSLGITGTLTLDAQGDPNAVFIFQMGSTLTTAAENSNVVLNGAQACNVFWQVGSSATLGTNTTFQGNHLGFDVNNSDDRRSGEWPIAGQRWRGYIRHQHHYNNDMCTRARNLPVVRSRGAILMF